MICIFCYLRYSIVLSMSWECRSTGVAVGVQVSVGVYAFVQVCAYVRKAYESHILDRCDIVQLLHNTVL